jgi:DNA modification methylase
VLPEPVPAIREADAAIYVGDARKTLSGLPGGSVDCIVTSPPYWAKRDYETGGWEGGDPTCEHRAGPPQQDGRGGIGALGTRGTQGSSVATARPMRSRCLRCGAARVDEQLGVEDTPAEFVASLVATLDEARRVLADHGTLWLNLGDTYSGGGGYAPNAPSNQARDASWPTASGRDGSFVVPNRDRREARTSAGSREAGVPAKNLLLVPARVAIALQDAGWVLRAEIVWAKRNGMPESVADRPTSSHEMVYVLAKRARYWSDFEALREPAEWARWGDQRNPKHEGSESAASWISDTKKADLQKRAAAGKNIRDVWWIATESYPGAHFAVFPRELARRCIVAGCPAEVCVACAKPRLRIVDEDAFTERTLGWTDCGCGAGWRPGVVLDPFMGSGTTAEVARLQRRHIVGIELKDSYVRTLIPRRLAAGAGRTSQVQREIDALADVGQLGLL